MFWVIGSPSVNVDIKELDVVDQLIYLCPTVKSSVSLDIEIDMLLTLDLSVITNLNNRMRGNTHLTENTKLCV